MDWLPLKPQVREVKYMELGNEFYFGAEESEQAGGAIGPIGDGGDGTGVPFSIHWMSMFTLDQMAQLCRAVKQAYPDIEIGHYLRLMLISNIMLRDWNEVIIDCAWKMTPSSWPMWPVPLPHWYQREEWYEDQTGPMPPISQMWPVPGQLLVLPSII